MLHCSICCEYTSAAVCCGKPTLDLNTLPVIAQSDGPTITAPGPSDSEDDLPELQDISG